ncbi:MAG: hypothetical protein ACI8P3_004147 [Saprospiraceae bacterium]|jgi:hypothetical protein
MNPRKKLHRFLALFMAGLVFLTSTGFTIDVHYCQDKIKRISFIGKAKTCQEVAACHKAGEKKAVKSCHNQNISCGEKLSHKGCCENNSTFVKYNGDLPAVTTDAYQVTELQTIPAIFFSSLQLSSISNTQAPTFLNYWPPPLERDIPVLLHRYLC